MADLLDEAAGLIIEEDLYEWLFWNRDLAPPPLPSEPLPPLSITYTFLNAWPSFFNDTPFFGGAGYFSFPGFQLESWQPLSDTVDKPEQSALRDKILSTSSLPGYRGMTFADVIPVEFFEHSQTGTTRDDVGQISYFKAPVATDVEDPRTGQLNAHWYIDGWFGDMGYDTQDKAGIVLSMEMLNEPRQYLEGTLGYITMMHETAHALGLNEANVLSAQGNGDFDSLKYSIMSYLGPASFGARPYCLYQLVL